MYVRQNTRPLTPPPGYRGTAIPPSGQTRAPIGHAAPRVPEPPKEENLPRVPVEEAQTYSPSLPERHGIFPFPPGKNEKRPLAEDDLLLLALLFLLLSGKDDAVKENGDVILLLGFLFLIGHREADETDV